MKGTFSDWGKKGGRDVVLAFYVCIKNAVCFEKYKILHYQSCHFCNSETKSSPY